MKTFREFLGEKGKKIASGVCLFRRNPFAVFLVHPSLFGGKGNNSYGFPKGGCDSSDLLKEGIREFEEETGILLNHSKDLYTYLGKQETSAKVIHLYAYEGTGKEKFISSNLFTYFDKKKQIEIELPENDSGDWFDLDTAKKVLFKNQKSFIDNFKQIIF